MTDTPDTPFAKMAERIVHNAGSTFGGAFVIVPPNGEPPIEILILDAKPDPGQFWGTIKTKAQIALTDLEEKQRRLPPGYR